MKSLVTLKSSKDFLEAKKGLFYRSRSFLLQAFEVKNSNEIKVGYTVSKQNGNAVVRNKIKRRLRVLANTTLGNYGVKNWNYVIIGQNFGAKNFLRVKESYFKAVIYGFTLMIVSGLIIFISADKIVSIFSDNPSVISFGTTYLKISALIFPAYPIFFISNGFFMAIKKSSYSMYLNIIRNVILPIPTIIVAIMIDGSFQTFFWSYCFFNWLYVICLFIFVSSYIKRNLN